MLSVKNISNLEPEELPFLPSSNLNYDIKEFPSFEEALSYSKTLPGGHEHREKKFNKDGFLVFVLDKEEKVWSYDEIVIKQVFKSRSNNPVRYYPVYKDVTDKTSVVHLIITPKKQKIVKV